MNVTATEAAAPVTLATSGGDSSASADAGFKIHEFVDMPIDHFSKIPSDELQTIVAAVFCVAGPLFAIAGTRVIKPFCGLLGFLSGFGFSFWMAYHHGHMEEKWAVVIGVSVGAVVGVLMACAYWIAAFLLGVSLGFLIGLVLIMIDGGRFSHTSVTDEVVVVAAAFIGGVSAFFYETSTLVASSALVGSYMFVAGLFKFLHQATNPYALFRHPAILFQCHESACIALMVVWGCMSLVGLIVQVKHEREKSESDAIDDAEMKPLLLH